MRQARLKMDSREGSGWYHCISRVVDRRFIFGEMEAEQFVHWMTAYAEFCGVRVLTYCVMSNHFHVLVEVCQRPEAEPGLEALMGRYERLHGREAAEGLREEMAVWSDPQLDAWREGMLAQMWDLSAYMKLVKQRFTQWYNRRQQRKGTLWEERFKSVVVEGRMEALAAVAAYIDLNPVRAGLMEDPAGYRWSGYGAAVAGKRAAKEGLAAVLNVGQGRAVSRSEALALYRCWLFGEGMVEGVSGEGTPAIRAGIDPERVREVLARKGRLSWGEYVRCRVRYFADSTVLGSRAWVEEVFERHRDRFGPQRKDGARKLRFLEHQQLFGWRDLRVEVVRGPLS